MLLRPQAGWEKMIDPLFAPPWSPLNPQSCRGECSIPLGLPWWRGLPPCVAHTHQLPPVKLHEGNSGALQAKQHLVVHCLRDVELRQLRLHVRDHLLWGEEPLISPQRGQVKDRRPISTQKALFFTIE